MLLAQEEPVIAYLKALRCRLIKIHILFSRSSMLIVLCVGVRSAPAGEEREGGVG